MLGFRFLRHMSLAEDSSSNIFLLLGLFVFFVHGSRTYKGFRILLGFSSPLQYSSICSACSLISSVSCLLLSPFYVLVNFFSFLFNDLSYFKVKFHHLNKGSSICLSLHWTLIWLNLINIILLGFQHILILSTQLARGLTIKTKVKNV